MTEKEIADALIAGEERNQGLGGETDEQASEQILHRC